MGDVDAERSALAEHLRIRRTAILEAWREAIKRDPALNTGASLPRSQLVDHIPAMLSTFERELGAARDGSYAASGAAQEYAAAHGLRPLARIRSWATVGVAPARTGLAPIDAIPRAIARAGLQQRDIALFEINEAFCSVPVAASRALAIDPNILNVNGSGCSLGHPIAATGARMVITMLSELTRRGAQFGCVSMCAGGGMGAAMIVERP